MSNSADPLLSVRGVTVRFGGIVALDGVSFDVRRGDICGLIGPNGAGKTTLLNLVSGFYPPQAGSVRLGASGSHIGSGGAMTKVDAARLAADAGVRVTVTATPLLERLIGGERLGTEFEPNPDARR